MRSPVQLLELHPGVDLLPSAVAALPFVTFTFDTDGVVVSAGGAPLGADGLDPARLPGVALCDAGTGCLQIQDAARRCLNGAQVSTRVPVQDGHLVVRLEPVRDASGTVTGGTAVVLDITARVRAEHERQIHAQWLGILDEQVRQSRHGREDLLAVIAHELRTPLTPIVGGLKLLMASRGPERPDHEQLVLAAMQRSVDRLQRTVDNLVLLSDGRSGAVAARCRPTQAGAVVRQVIADLGSDAPPVVVTGDVYAVAWVDPQHLRLMCRELIHNAHTHGAPPIEVAIDTVDDQIEIAVTDHGPGVATELQERLFAPFVPADHATTRTAQGLGIGLSTLRLLAELNHGRIDLDHDHRRGARFRLSLRASVNAAAPPRPQDARSADPDPSERLCPAS